MRAVEPHVLMRAADLLGISANDLADALGSHGTGRLAGVDLQQRDDLLRAAAARHFPNPSHKWQAEQLSAALERYRASAWQRRDQWAEACPHDPDSRVGLFWRMLRLSTHIPRPRTIRTVLAAGGRDYASSQTGQSSGRDR